MKTRQKAMLVTVEHGRPHGLDDLNLALGRGWRVAHVTPMGGAGVGADGGEPALCLAALVVLERGRPNGTAALETAEEEIEEVVEEIIEGDGASLPVDDDFDEAAG